LSQPVDGDPALRWTGAGIGDEDDDRKPSPYRRAPSARTARELELTDAVGKVRLTALRSTMNTDKIKGNWKQLVGKAKEKWGKLTDDDWKVVEGKRDQLIGKVQERYGITREEAERQLADFERTHEKV
jgi:uncharacterized protein YjbJ (UPF0337 family)